MNFIRGLLLITGVLVLLATGLKEFTGDRLIHSYVWYMLAFFLFVTSFSHYVAHLGVKHDPKNLHVYYFSSMGVRMVFCIIAIFVYRYYHEEQVAQFVFNFFVLYFTYTTFEIYSLLSNLRRNSKKQI